MFKHLEANDIFASLEGTTRQYLVGQLKMPQALTHYADDGVEIGLTSYTDYTIEAPHWHKVAYEYQYMISGETKYLDMESGEETSYVAGDFYRIEPGTQYAQKALGETLILFVKTPPGNDKVAMESSSRLEMWYSNWGAKY